MVHSYEEQLEQDRIAFLVRDLEEAQERINALKLKIEKQRTEMRQLTRQFSELLEESREDAE